MKRLVNRRSKGKVVPDDAVMAHRGRRGLSPLILNLSSW